MTAPTRIGRSATCAAACTVCLVIGSTVGSMSVEFSGQSRKSGCGSWPSRILVIRWMVSDKWLLVTERARPIASMPRPGMLPCTIPTRTLPAEVAAGSA